MDPLKIIQKYYDKDSKAYKILVEHSRRVADRALLIAKKVRPLPDLKFIEEAGMLHDIGVFKVHAPDIGCNGDKPYICHGYLGREILEKEGYPKHALVCERHIGAGLTVEDIKKQKLPLPLRNMTPKTVEEEIIAYADKFFSKSSEDENPLALVRESLRRFGKLDVFDKWVEKYG